MKNRSSWHKTHDPHGWSVQTTDHIFNVPYLETHLLVKCGCSWYGWIERGNKA